MNNPPPIPGKPARFQIGAVAASAFFYPGAGQFIQRRPLWGAGYALVFSGFLVAFLVCAGTIIYHYYSLIDPRAELAPRLPVVPMLIAFAAAMLTWVANVADAAAAGWRNVQRNKRT